VGEKVQGTEKKKEIIAAFSGKLEDNRFEGLLSCARL
jgi:hypothetical protein